MQYSIRRATVSRQDNPLSGWRGDQCPPAALRVRAPRCHRVAARPPTWATLRLQVTQVAREYPQIFPNNLAVVGPWARLPFYQRTGLGRCGRELSGAPSTALVEETRRYCGFLRQVASGAYPLLTRLFSRTLSRTHGIGSPGSSLDPFLLARHWGFSPGRAQKALRHALGVADRTLAGFGLSASWRSLAIALMSGNRRASRVGRRAAAVTAVHFLQKHAPFGGYANNQPFIVEDAESDPHAEPVQYLVEVREILREAVRLAAARAAAVRVGAYHGASFIWPGDTLDAAATRLLSAHVAQHVSARQLARLASPFAVQQQQLLGAVILENRRARRRAAEQQSFTAFDAGNVWAAVKAHTEVLRQHFWVPANLSDNPEVRRMVDLCTPLVAAYNAVPAGDQEGLRAAYGEIQALVASEEARAERIVEWAEARLAEANQQEHRWIVHLSSPYQWEVRLPEAAAALASLLCDAALSGSDPAAGFALEDLLLEYGQMPVLEEVALCS
jgi:hypothetical protein